MRIGHKSYSLQLYVVFSGNERPSLGARRDAGAVESWDIFG